MTYLPHTRTHSEPLAASLATIGLMALDVIGFYASPSLHSHRVVISTPTAKEYSTESHTGEPALLYLSAPIRPGFYL